MIVYGRHPVLEYIASGKDVDKVLLLKSIEKDFLFKVQSLCRDKKIPVQIVPKEKLNRTSKENHQGVIAVVPMIRYSSLDEIIAYTKKQQEAALIVILDNITDVRNFGSIARSAECLGAHAIIMSDTGAAPVNEISMKTSAGALAHLMVSKVNRLADAIAFLQNNNIQVVASSLSAKTKLNELDLKEPTAIILGAEDHGVQKYLLKSADKTFSIPQLGATDSLNVSVANGIILYEVQRQRRS